MDYSTGGINGDDCRVCEKHVSCPFFFFFFFGMLKIKTLLVNLIELNHLKFCQNHKNMIQIQLRKGMYRVKSQGSWGSQGQGVFVVLKNKSKKKKKKKENHNARVDRLNL